MSSVSLRSKAILQSFFANLVLKTSCSVTNFPDCLITNRTQCPYSLKKANSPSFESLESLFQPKFLNSYRFVDHSIVFIDSLSIRLIFSIPIILSRLSRSDNTSISLTFIPSVFCLLVEGINVCARGNI